MSYTANIKIKVMKTKLKLGKTVKRKKSFIWVALQKKPLNCTRFKLSIR